MPARSWSYIAVLRTENAARTFGAALVGRLSYGVVFLSLVLAVTRATGSYTVAGTFSALFGLTSSLLSPLRARLIDRRGIRPVLLPMASVYALLLVAVAVATWRTGAPPVVLWAMAVAAGAFTPPLGPIMRSLWTGIVPNEELRQRAFALDTVGEELLYVTGPLLAGLFAVLVNPALGVLASAALILAGGVLLATSPAASVNPPAVKPPMAAPVAKAPVVEASVAGPSVAEASVAEAPVVEAPVARQRPAGIYRPVVVSAAIGACLGALSLLVVAFADREHHIAAVAWVEAVLAVGSVVGGLLYGAITWRLSGPARLPVLAGALGAVLAVAGLSGNLLVLVALVGVAGLFISPALTTAYLVADDQASAGARVQAGTWVNTAYNLANSLGAGLIGLLISRVPLAVCFAVAAAPAIVAGLLPAKALLARNRR